jgi:beta-glucosidase
MTDERDLARPTAAFPPGFRWGVATAAHQIEGGNWNNDWWAWEHTPGSAASVPSGDACGSWEHWRRDVDLCHELGVHHYRFSIEWSRIEPEDGLWSLAAVGHYREQCQALLDAGIDPVVTLHHFTTPRWVADRGGWGQPETARRFAAFAERAVGELAPVLRRVCTLNEPNIVAAAGYLAGSFPPGRRDVEARRRANATFVEAHRLAVDAVRAAAPGVPVGLTLAMSAYEPVGGGEEKLARIRHRMEDEFLAATGGDDFLGVQAYSRTRVGPQGAVAPDPGARLVETMGYEFWPAALEATVRRAWEVTAGGVPILVTENGIAAEDDATRIEYVSGSLAGLARCIADGIDVRGYTYWTLIDNFEWALGYRPRFGLATVDRTTFERALKPSGEWYAEVVRANGPVPAGAG